MRSGGCGGVVAAVGAAVGVAVGIAIAVVVVVVGIVIAAVAVAVAVDIAVVDVVGDSGAVSSTGGEPSVSKHAQEVVRYVIHELVWRGMFVGVSHGHRCQEVARGFLLVAFGLA